MAKDFSARLAAIALVVAALLYVGFQAYRSFYNPYKTERAYEYTVADSIQTQGLFVRAEQAIPAAQAPSVGYLVRDGEKVIPPTVVANLYSSDTMAKDFALLDQLDQEIALLSKIQIPSASTFSNTEMISSQIVATMGQMVDGIATGNGAEVAPLRNTLLEGLCKKQLSVGQATDFNARIDYLTSQRDSLAARVGDSRQPVAAGLDGYFSRVSDGLESTFTPEAVAEMSADDLRQAMIDLPKAQGSPLGKVMTKHIWSLALVVSDAQAEKFREGTSVFLNVNSQNITDLPMTVTEVRRDKKNKEEPGDAVVMLSSDYIQPGILSARCTPVEINFTSYSGLRISETAVRALDGVEGVYVIDGMLMRFKPIKVVYSGVGYKIVELPVAALLNASDPKQLRLFDEVIVEGIDLYDGKKVR